MKIQRLDTCQFQFPLISKKKSKKKRVTCTNLLHETALFAVRPTASSGGALFGIVLVPTNGKRSSTLSCARFTNRPTEVATISRLKVREL